MDGVDWRILTAEETQTFYESKRNEIGYDSSKNFEDCLHRLIQRGLVAEGIGKTKADALYDLLSELYIVPISESILLRTISFVRLTVFHGVPFSAAKKLFGRDKRSENEKKVMHLAKQTLLSTAEIIKCIETDSLNFNSEEQLLDTLYYDNMTTCDNIAETSRNFASCRPVLTSVTNLLLRRQIILERL